MLQPGRHGNTTNYKYGYQGSELENEIKGEGNSYTTHYRLLDPRLNRWLSIDPKRTAFESPYSSMSNNPILYNDPYGDTIRYSGSSEFKIKQKVRVFFLSVFGSKETRGLIRDLKKSPHDIIVQQGSKKDFLTNSAQPKSLVDYERENFFKLPPVPDYLGTPDEIKKQQKEFDQAMAEYDKNKPKGYITPGVGDGSYVTLPISNNPRDWTEMEKAYWDTQGKNVKMNSFTTIIHEFYHAWRIANGLVTTRNKEEVKAVQFVNKNMRNENNRRDKYDQIEVPKKKN